MQPACVPLRLFQGATFRDVLRLSQPTRVYRDIQSIQAVAPVRLVVPDHGVPSEWPVWVVGVQQWPEINRQPVTGRPWQALRVDENTLEINTLSAVGQRPAGGQLIYLAPVDLISCTARMQIRDRPGGQLLLELGSGPGQGLVIEQAGTIRREISAVQTGALPAAAAVYDLEVTFADGSVLRWVEGPVTVSPQVTL
ncbi:hypothetical protein [Metapseudomonas furukawaii]|uniref:Phage protein n=1 Tax=Metapseudomonas furukawaii TaxID=1149133 RepID=A0AAD1FI49_METFU|nr:hypothetical protein [Pseudomonas furukawaii]ELS25688.1 hypothetical protein ppKF707_0784 [Pseudomonas furukawaii]BAU76123.1 phage protein [Pseudomonas furukawaii]